jgi:hypothetical protein
MTIYIDNKPIEDFKEIKIVTSIDGQDLVVTFDELNFSFDLFVNGEHVAQEDATVKEVMDWMIA